MPSVVCSIFALARTLALLVVLLAGENLYAGRLVAVSSAADSGYARRRAGTNPPPVETYVFAKGTFSKGITHDNTLERMPFLRVAETLAYDLRRQNYFPTRDLQNADLVIVVHWGVTLPNDSDASLVSLDPNAISDAIAGIAEAKEAETADKKP